MASFVEPLKLLDIAQRMKDGAHWPLICLVAALLEGCGKLSLGSYGTGAGGRVAEDDYPGALGAGGPQSAGGYGNASGGVPQSQPTAGTQQGGGLPAFGGASNGGMVQGGSPGTGASGSSAGSGGVGGAGVSSGGVSGEGVSSGGVSSGGVSGESEAGQGGTGGEPSGGGASSGRPSCKGLPTRCGGSAEDCCTSIDVPGGHFFLGAGSDEAADARVSDFTLDKYEVTVDRFHNFLSHYDEWRAGHHPAPGAGANPHVGGSGWQSSWDSQLPPTASEMEARILDCSNSPFSALRVTQNFGPVAMNCVNWYEASAFCAWDGARLPTELEWEYAATGGDRAWPYPWGTDEPAEQYAKYNCVFSLRLDQYDPAQPPCILSVGQKSVGAGRWGHLDLAGLMAEWVFDTDRFFPSLCTDCANTSAGVTRGRRGGDWIEDATWLGGAHRSSFDASGRSYFGGLRCAFSQSPAPCAASCDSNADCSGAEGQVTCICREGFVGDGHTCARPRSCAELHRARPELGSGRYFLAPNASDPASEFLAWCEMSAEEGGWTLVLNQNETFDPTSLGNDYCFSSGCTNLAYSRVPLESDLLLDFDRDPIVGDQFSARALISGVQLAALGKTVRELFTTGPFFIDREDNSNVSVRVPSQLPCTQVLPGDLSNLLCQSCPTGQSCKAPVLVFGDSDSDCETEPLRFAIGGAFSYSDPWGNCAGWPQAPQYYGDYYTNNVRIWIR